MQRQIAIDFSTTTTVVAYQDTGSKPEILKFEGRNYVPTMILTEGSILNKNGMEIHHDEAFGWDAYHASKFHALLKNDFKLGLLSNDAKIRQEAQTLTKKFFQFLYAQYNAHAVFPKGTVFDTVSTLVTYPAKFPETVQQFLKKTAQEAGFKNVELLDEARAAMAFSLANETGRIQQYIQNLPHKQLRVMLIDMGAGTTDIAVFRYSVDNPSAFEHLCSWPENGSCNFGGREIDRILCDFYKEKLGSHITKVLGQGNATLGDVILQNKIKDFKENTLSRELKHNAIVSNVPGDLVSFTFSMDNPDIDLDRASFAALLKDYLPQFQELVQGALAKAGLSGKEIDLVLLTGGHSQWYFVPDLLTQLEISKDAIFSFPEPHLVVALGAASYTLSEKAPRSDPNLPSAPDRSVRILLNGAKPAYLSIDNTDSDTPVHIVICNSTEHIELMPDKVIKAPSLKANELLLICHQTKYMLSFASSDTAQIWFKRIPVRPQSLFEKVSLQNLHLEPRYDGVYWGFHDDQNIERLPHRWDDADHFSEGLAAVKQNGKWGFIDKNGTLVISCRFSWVRAFSEGYTAVELDGLWNFVDRQGTLICSRWWDSAYPFCEGRAPVRSGEKWGYVDTDGFLTIPCVWDDITSFEQGKAQAKKVVHSFFGTRTEEHVIDRNGNTIRKQTI